MTIKAAALCDGEWMLFMDADAHLAPGTLKRAISFAEQSALDCVSVMPQVGPAGLVGDAVFDVSLALMSNGGRLREVRDAASRQVAANGAFILVRKAAFDRTPGFDWLRLEVADDFGLVLMLKSHGARCDIVNGGGEVKLEWYASFGEMSRAMQKNFYAIMARISLLRSIALSMFAMWMALFGLAALLPVGLALRAIAVVGVAALTTATVLAARVTGRARGAAFLWPVGFLGIAWMALRSGVIGHHIGGIAWRGVVYPSALLAAHQRVRV